MLGFTHLQFEAPLTAARESANRHDFALAAMPGLLGLRIFKAPASATWARSTVTVSFACSGYHSGMPPARAPWRQPASFTGYQATAGMRPQQVVRDVLPGHPPPPARTSASTSSATRTPAS